MKQMVAKFISTNMEAWDQHLNNSIYASRHESSLYSPFEIMFGRKATIPIELEYEKEGSIVLEACLQKPEVSIAKPYMCGILTRQVTRVGMAIIETSTN